MKIPALAGASADVSAEKGLGDTIYEAVVSIIEGITNFINQLGSSAFGSVYSSVAPYVMILAMSWVVLKAVGVFTKQDNFRGLFMGGSKIGIVALSFFILQSNNPAKILGWLQDGYESAIGVFGGTPSDKGGVAGIFETLWKTTVGLYDFMSSSYNKMVDHTLANLDGSWYEILGTHLSIGISKLFIFLIILLCQILAILTVLTLTFLVFLNHVTFTALLVIFPFVLLL